MKIALLNLPFDNNYGGNLQRYALMRVLSDMGHDVTHLKLMFDKRNQSCFCYPLILCKYILKCMLGKKCTSLYSSLFPKRMYERQNRVVDAFYNKYIKHTDAIYQVKDLRKYIDFDIFVVGSDQVWRKSIANKYLSTMFFDYLIDKPCIAYSVSLGSANNELTDKDVDKLGVLYKRFVAVSVRERSALDLFDSYNWKSPAAVHTLDPTMLLNKEDYKVLIENGNTKKYNAKLFCYILDRTKEKEEKIKEISMTKNLIPFYFSIKGTKNVSVEQWLRLFHDAEYVITDSYHGLIFSIIFNKPFFLFKNELRGNARFDSVYEILDITDSTDDLDWNLINRKIETLRLRSKSFLYSSLNCL